MSKHELSRLATEILRAKGFTAGGRPKAKVSVGQASFERRIISTPIGGQPGYRIHIRPK